MSVSDDEVERLWEGEEDQMDDEDKDWLIQRLREKDIPHVAPLRNVT